MTEIQDCGKYNNQKVVALYKTFSGEEFVEASLASIYRLCHKIVLVHSSVSWSGEVGNTVAPVVEEWKLNYDTCNKIVNLYVDLRSQDEQYKYGFDYIKKNIPCDLVLLIDTDEVWDEDQLQELFIRACNDTEHNAFSCRLHTYIKSIHYKVEPMEWCKPTVLVRTSQMGIIGPRGINNSPKVLYNDIKAHHFTYVRKDEETVMKKIKTSFIGDGPGTHCVPMEDWIENKWKKLPFATDFHTTKTAETSWHSIKPILVKDLPAAVRNSVKILSSLLPFGHLVNTDYDILFQYSQNVELAVDLGTYRGRSAITLSLHARHVVTIDLFEDITTHDNDELKQAYDFYGKDRSVYNNVYNDVKKQLSLYSNIEVVKGITYDEAKNFADESVDLVFIDGDHSYVGVKKDFDSWISKVKVGGYIIFHDYSDLFPDVMRFVEEVKLLPNIKHVETVIPTTVLQKI